MKGTIQSEHMNMPARIHSNENGLDYTLHGDYYPVSYTHLTLPTKA